MKRAGELLGALGFESPGRSVPEASKADAEPAADSGELTRLQHQLIDSAVDIRRRQPLSADLSFIAKHLVQVTLPHSDPGEVPLWTRTNGDLTLVIARTGVDPSGKPIGYPYGTIPRLLLYWITREAVRSRSRRLELGDNLSQFMRQVGLNPNTGRGKRGDAQRLKEQMIRLFSSSISFQYTRTLSGVIGQRTLGMLIAPRRELWWDPRSLNQSSLWQSWIELGEDFYNAIVSSAVPVDVRALRAIKNSPLALDLYGWATYKAYQLSHTGQSQEISYQQFMRQFGADYTTTKNFKKKFLAALAKVRQVYPQLRVEIIEGGLRVLPSPPSVSNAVGRQKASYRPR
jgi:hypothetical protein